MDQGRGSRLLALLLASVGGVAQADPAAEQLFRDAKQLLKDGKRDEACDMFQRSLDLEARFGTALNLGDCLEQQGHLAKAWEMFLTAKALAARTNDPRGSEAEKRAAALEPKLAHMTLKVARVEGLAITRNGQPVAPAAFDVKVPLDPNTYVLEAKAPGYKPWTATVELGAGGSREVTVELVADPTAIRKPPPPVKAERTGVAPPLRTGAIGLGLGSNSDSDLVYGLRGIVGVPVQGGALRFNATVLYAHFSNDPMDPDNNTHLLASGIAVEYFRAFHAGLGAGVGIGFGVDISKAAYDNETRTQAWLAPRASPIVFRVASPALEVGLHLSFVVPQNKLVGIVGLDWFL